MRHKGQVDVARIVDYIDSRHGHGKAWQYDVGVERLEYISRQ